MCSFGITRTWVGATGRMSSKATISSSRKTTLAGISRAKILQNRQSSAIRPSLPAEKTVGARRQRTHGRQRPQRLVAMRGVHRDVVIAQAAHLLRQTPVPDHLQIAADETSLVGSLLRIRLSLQAMAALAADRVVHREAESRRRRPRPRRVAKDVHARQAGLFS